MLKAYLQRDKEVKRDLQTVVDDQAERIQVWRITNNGVADPGFEESSSAWEKVATIKGRIDMVTGSYNRIPGQAGEATEVLYVGVTEDKDVRMNDEWRLRGSRYKVDSINTINGPTTEVILRRLH